MSIPPPPLPAPGSEPPPWQAPGASQGTPGLQVPPPPPQTWQQPTAQPVERTSSPFAWLGILAAIVCAVGSALVWAEVAFEGETIAEIKGFGEEGDRKDGVITMPLAIIAAVLMLLGALTKRRVLHIIAAVVAGLAAIISFIDIGDIKDSAVDGIGAEGFDVTIGIGLWLTAIGATIATICAIVAAVQTKKRRAGY